MSEMPSVIGKYRVLRRIGEGGMGAVYLAHDDGIDRDVAIKLLRADNESTRRRFTGEAQSAGRLKHPNIVTVYDFGEVESGPYLVMEFVEGSTLGQIIERGDSLPLARRLWLLEQVCHGLSYAHRAGIVHRDIKPSNLMVDSEGTIKIVDFGIARSDGRDLTMTGKVVGTPAYMAPEQIRGEPLDRRCDIFSLGLVVFEFLSNRRAFTGDSDYVIANRIVTGAPEPFYYPNEEVAAYLAPVIDRALAKDPNDRYQDAELMAADLSQIARRLESLSDHAPIPFQGETVVLAARATETITATIHPAATSSRFKPWGWLGLAAAIGIAGWVLARPDRDLRGTDTGAVLPAVSEPAQPENVRTAPPDLPPAPPGGSAPAPPTVVQQVSTPQVHSAPVAPASSAGSSEKPVRPTAESKFGPRLLAAQSLAAAGDHEGAIKAFDEVLAIDPQNALAIDGLANARRAKSRARTSTLQVRLAAAEQKLSDGAYDEAIKIFESVLQIDGESPEAADGIARAQKARAAEDAILKVRTKKPPLSR